MSIKMIVVDLDDTLLYPDKSLSAYTMDVLHRCREKGIIIVVATGRTEKACTRLLPLIKPDVEIYNCGALARIGNNVLHQTMLLQHTANLLLSRCLVAASDGYAIVETSDGYITNEPLRQGMCHEDLFKCTAFDDFKHGLNGDVYKLMFNAIDRNAAEALIYNIPNIRLQNDIGSNWCEILHIYANKWNALNVVFDFYSIKPDEVVAFGDDTIDLDMLIHCGIGVAMANGLDIVKEASNAICDRNDCDGVAKWIELNILSLSKK